MNDNDFDMNTQLMRDASKKDKQIKELIKEKDEHKKKLDDYKKQFDIQIKNAIDSRITDESYFKIPEKRSLFNPLSWFKSDKTNPMVMCIFSPAGDLTIRERVADQRGNLKLAKKVEYRIENTAIWDIAESDVSGFRGKKVLFYFQDIPNPLMIKKVEEDKVKFNVTTETYSKSQKSHIISELLTEDLTFKDYITMVMMGATLLLNLVIVAKLFFLK